MRARNKQHRNFWRLSEVGQSHQDKLNMETGIVLAPAVWKKFADTVTATCKEWNEVTQEQTLTCKETILGDLRIWCAGRTQQLTVHYDHHQEHCAGKTRTRSHSRHRGVRDGVRARGSGDEKRSTSEHGDVDPGAATRFGRSEPQGGVGLLHQECHSTATGR